MGQDIMRRYPERLIPTSGSREKSLPALRDRLWCLSGRPRDWIVQKNKEKRTSTILLAILSKGSIVYLEQ